MSNTIQWGHVTTVSRRFKLLKNVGTPTKLCPLMIKAYSEMMVSSNTESLEYISVFSVSGPPLNFSLLGPMILSLAVLRTNQQKVIQVIKTCMLWKLNPFSKYIHLLYFYNDISSYIPPAVPTGNWLPRTNGCDFIICEMIMWTLMCSALDWNVTWARVGPQAWCDLRLWTPHSCRLSACCKSSRCSSPSLREQQKQWHRVRTECMSKWALYVLISTGYLACLRLAPRSWCWPGSDRQ